jgi:mannose-6-phosphate isomerase-like protein (cupin superfamily)
MNSAAITADWKPYETGEVENRPWGRYLVTSTGRTEKGEEYCKKIITIEPGKILSLQSHAHRSEHWRVQEGTLTVVLDSRIIELKTGESLEIPAKALHSIANLGAVPCKVHERQLGVCREEDTTRYADAYGRPTVRAHNDYVKNSLQQYIKIMKKLGI